MSEKHGVSGVRDDGSVERGVRSNLLQALGRLSDKSFLARSEIRGGGSKNKGSATLILFQLFTD